MSRTRRELCGALAAGTALLLVPGCGGDDAAEPAQSRCGATGIAITLNHGHALVIAQVDLDSIAELAYGIRGSSDHDHTVTLGVSQLGQLKAGESVMTVASVAAAHSHVVTITCTP